MNKAGILATLVISMAACAEEEGEVMPLDGEGQLQRVEASGLVELAVKPIKAAQNISIVGYSTYLGFGGNEDGFSIATDGSGSSYIAGTTASACPSSNAAYVAKLAASGTLVYYVCLSVSGTGDVAADSAGNAYVAVGNAILKLDPAGALVYGVTVAGWTFNDLAIDAAGSAYVVGNLPVSGRSQDVLLAKLNAAGTAFDYALSLGGTASDIGYGIAVDDLGNAYLTGITESTNFPLWNAFQATLRGPQDAFVTRVNPTGTSLVYSTYLGGNTYDYGFAIAADGAGNSWITGSTSSLNGVQSFPVTAGSAQAGQGGGGDAFIARFSAVGARVFASYLGGSGAEVGQGVAVDRATGNSYVTGYTQSTNFPVRAGAFQSTARGGADAFVTQVSSAGSSFSYSSYLGGSSTDLGAGITVDAAKNVYVTGSTFSTNFPTNVYAPGGGYDAFITNFLGP